MLHPPYTAWHLSYVALGAAAAPVLHADRLAAALAAFFLAVGIAAHALDELHGRPLQTRLSRTTLIVLAVTSLGGAVAIGIAGAITISAWLAPLVAIGAFLVVAYNLELFGGAHPRRHVVRAGLGRLSRLSTGYFVNALQVRPAGVLVAMACTLSLERGPAAAEHARPGAAAADGRSHRHPDAHLRGDAHARRARARRAA